MMNFFEAMTALQNGRKIRPVHWDAHQWVALREEQFKLFGRPKSSYQIVNQKLEILTDWGYLGQLVGKEWEEWKEKKE